MLTLHVPSERPNNALKPPGWVPAWAALSACLFLCAQPVLAERADRDKPVQIESDRMEYDEGKRVSIFTGRVILTKGTIAIRGDRLIVQEDAQGFRQARAEGKPASFRQKREGLDEFIEGAALTIEYDSRTESAVLTERAQLRRLAREKVIDEVQGARITYLSGAERYAVEGNLGGAQEGERVRMVIQPRKAEDDAARGPVTGGSTAPAPGSPATGGGSPVLKPAEQLRNPPGQR